MAIYSSDYGPGDVDTHVFDEGFLATLLYFAPEGGQLSENSKDIVYNLGGGGSAVFSSDAGFDGLWSGTVNAISYVVDGTVVSGGTGLAIDGTALRDAMAAGDTATINRLAWSGNDVLNGGASDDTLRGFDGRDTILGGAGNDRLVGDAGNDRIVGGSGADDIFGGTGSDRLFGGAGADVIVGGDGNDVIGGGAGSDSLSGGRGADTFEFRSLGQLKGFDYDYITDFSHAEGDKIDVSMIDANTTQEGDQAYTFIDRTGDVQPAVVPGIGSLVVETSATAGTYAVSLYYDDAGNHLLFYVVSATALTADDFVL